MQRDVTQNTVTRPPAEAASVNTAGEETAAAMSGTTPDGDKPPFTPSAEPGEIGRLGKYRIQRELGRGGMGAVYLAFDERLQRKVALKVMLPKAAANATAKDRFLREARAAAQISSDHVVNIFEADEIDGVPFIALQYLQGYPLDEYLKKKGNPTLPQVIRLGRETALGLAAAHKLGMVHRDIKPGNVWLEAPGGRVKILDFGLAKPVVSREQHELTASGAIVGTPAYMAPEQGMGRNVDGRADLFSLGCMLYRLACGRLPFEGPTLMAILTAIATQDPPPVRAVNPAVPEPLATLIHRLLAKNPADRPASAAEVAKELEAMGGAPKRGADVNPDAPTVTQPQVVYMPIAVSAQQSNPFEHLVDDEPSSVEEAPTGVEPKTKVATKRGKTPPWVWIATAAAGLVLLLGLGGFIIIKITNKDGTVTEVRVPEGSKIEVDGKVVKPEPKKPDAKPTPPVKPATPPRGVPPLPADLIAPMTPVKPEKVFTLDHLDPAKHIPPGEKFDWQPKELVAVLGSHRQRLTAYQAFCMVGPDGKRVICGDKMWDTSTMQETPAPAWMGWFAISPNSQRVATGNKVWEIDNPTKPPVTYPIPGYIRAFVKDDVVIGDEQVGPASGDYTFWKLHEKEPKPLKKFPAGFGASVSPDGKYFALLPTEDGPTEVYDISADGVPVNKRVLPGPEGKGKPTNTNKRILSFSRNGRLVTTNDQIHVWDITATQPKLICSTKQDPFWVVCLFESGDRLIGWTQSGFTLFSIADGTFKQVAGRPNPGFQQDNIQYLAVTPDGKTIITNHLNGAVRFWAIENDVIVERNPIQPQPRLSIDADFSPDGRFAVLPDESGEFILWNFADLSARRLAVHRESSTRFSPTGAVLSQNAPDGRASLTSVPDDPGRKPIQFGNDSWPYCFSSDGRWMAALTRKPELEIWDVAASPPKQLSSVTGFHSRDWRFTPDGRFLIRVGHGEVQCWAMTDRGPVIRGEVTYVPFNHFTLSPDGKVAIFSQPGQGYHFYDFKDGLLTHRRTDRGHASWAAFAPDGKSIAVYDQYAVSIRDPETGKELHRIQLRGASIFGRFHPDGRHLFVTNADRTTYILRLPKTSIAGMPAGKSGLRFEPSDRAVVVKVPIRPTTVVTVEAWVTFEAVQEGGGREFIHTPNGDVATDDGRLRMYSFHGHANAVDPIPKGRRVHVAGVNDGKKRYLYLDGKRVAESDDAGTPVPENEVLAAGDKWKMIVLGSSLFTGTIDAVRVSSVARYDKAFAPPATFEKDKDTFALYLFDEGMGDTLNDSSGNGYHAKISGAKWVKGVSAVPATDGLPGLRIDEKDAFVGVEVPTLKAPADGPLTLEGYVKFDHARLGENPTFFGWTYQYTMGWGGNTVGLTHFTAGEKGDGWKPNPAGVADDLARGTWHHLAAVREGKQNRLYVNGKLAAKGEVAEPIRAAGDHIGLFVIGSVCDGMTVREVRASKVARYSGDTFTPAARHEPDKDTLALYHCDDGTGRELKDSSGNNHHGKVNGGKWVTAADRDRQLAEWVLSVNGKCVVRKDGKNTLCTARDQLPAGAVELFDVNVAHEHATDENAARFAGLRHLTYLNLVSGPVTDRGVATLRDLPQLTYLNLHGTKVTDSCLPGLKELPELTTLILIDTAVSDDGLAKLKALPKLQGLVLHNTAVTDEGLQHLRAVSGLTELSVLKTKVTEAGVKKLAAALPKCKIEYDGGVIEPTAADDRTATEWLLSRGAKFGCSTPAGYHLFERGKKAELPPGPITLHHFNVTKAEFTGDGDLERFRGLKSVDTVVLVDTGLTDAGVEHLATLPKLEKAYLNETKVTSAGLAHLRGAKALSVLQLGDTAVGDAGLEHLAGVPSLTEVMLYKTKVTEAGVKKLAAALPKCKIAWDGGVIEPKRK